MNVTVRDVIARKNYDCQCLMLTNKNCNKKIKKTDKYISVMVERMPFPVTYKIHPNCATKLLKKILKEEKDSEKERIESVKDNIKYNIEYLEKQIELTNKIIENIKLAKK